MRLVHERTLIFALIENIRVQGTEFCFTSNRRRASGYATIVRNSMDFSYELQHAAWCVILSTKAECTVNNSVDSDARDCDRHVVVDIPSQNKELLNECIDSIPAVDLSNSPGLLILARWSPGQLFLSHTGRMKQRLLQLYNDNDSGS
ncbi:hypothetical protein GJ496_009386 [Pomphorhynchus laevis]|nr:hypothetical protein GJ496_009386 [Pomphorhynchus laevis]